MTAFDYAAWQRGRRRTTDNAATKKYEKTPRGFLMRAYRNMKSRVEGIQKAGSWSGVDLLPKEEFYAAALMDPVFRCLFRRYEESGFQRNLAPSPDRVDPERGYTLDNIEWVPMGVNCGRANKTKRGISVWEFA